MLHDVVIKQNKSSNRVNVMIDGMEIKGLTDVSYSASVVDDLPKVTIEFYAGSLNADKEDQYVSSGSIR